MQQNLMIQMEHQKQEADLKARNLLKQTQIEEAVDDLDLDSFGIIDIPPEVMPKQEDQAPKLPLFAIYTDSNTGTSTSADMSAIEQLLATVGVNASDIRKVDLANDYELAGWIKAQCNGDFIFPLVFMRKQRIGGLEALQQLSQNGELQKLISLDRSGERKDDDDDDCAAGPQLGVLDRALERVETVVSYFNPLGWIRWGSKNNTTGSASDTVEYDVIHTNWYWRHLRRKLRFCPTVFLRIHPKHGDVRSAHTYSDLASVLVKGTDTLVFNYSTGASPDWIMCSPRDQHEILTLLRKRAPNVVEESESATN